MAERILFVLGSILLVVGPARQALAELREARELLETLHDVKLTATLVSYLKWSVRVSFDVYPMLVWPPRLIRRIREAIVWIRKYEHARNAFAEAANANDERAVRIRAGLIKAKNWGIVLAGSCFIFAASCVSLGTYVASH